MMLHQRGWDECKTPIPASLTSRLVIPAAPSYHHSLCPWDIAISTPISPQRAFMLSRVLDKDGAPPLTCNGIGCRGQEERIKGQMGAVAVGLQPVSMCCSGRSATGMWRVHDAPFLAADKMLRNRGWAHMTALLHYDTYIRLLRFAQAPIITNGG